MIEVGIHTFGAQRAHRPGRPPTREDVPEPTVGRERLGPAPKGGARGRIVAVGAGGSLLRRLAVAAGLAAGTVDFEAGTQEGAENGHDVGGERDGVAHGQPFMGWAVTGWWPWDRP